MGSFTIKGGANQVNLVLKKLQNAQDSIVKGRMKAMNDVVTVVYKTASAKRPYITAQEAKAQGRKKVNGKLHRVSAPGASYGVPVAMFNGGTLQISVSKEVTSKDNKITGRIWTDNEYAKYLEMGTSKMKARPFMRPALDLNKDWIKRRFKTKE